MGGGSVMGTLGVAGRPWYGVARDVAVREWVVRVGVVNAEQVAARFGTDVRVARRMLGRLVEGGWVRVIEQPRARFMMWAATPKAVEALTGVRSKRWIGQPWHPLAVTSMVVVCELAGWEVLTDPELKRMSDGIGEDRLDEHPWTTGIPGSSRHLSDLVLTDPSGSVRPVAVEVELTKKTPERLARLLDGYALSNRFGSVWYVVPDPSLARHVERVAARCVSPVEAIRIITVQRPWLPELIVDQLPSGRDMN